VVSVVSDFSGIAGVTRSLVRLLDDRLVEPATVTASPPDQTPPNVGGARINLFLYRVSENATLRNQDLGGAAPPASYGRPPLSLDLHYLLHPVPVQASDDLAAHRLLGDAMLALHQVPIITPELRRSTPPTDPILDASLIGDVEHLRVSLAPATLDDLTKLWGATTAPIRVSAAYTVTVVRLEQTVPRRIAKPVLEPPDAGPRVHAVPLDRPQVSSVGVRRDGADPESPTPYARIGDELVVHGSGFVPEVRVVVGPVDVTTSVATDSTAQRIALTLPDDPDLGAGVHALQVVRDVELGEPGDPLSLPMRSNVVPIVVLPRVSSVAPANVAAGAALTVQGTRVADPDAPSYVLVGDRAVAATTGATSTQVTVDVPDLPTGTHPVSVRVNGVESIDTATVVVT
jgi:hypothetical protein